MAYTDGVALCVHSDAGASLVLATRISSNCSHRHLLSRAQQYSPIARWPHITAAFALFDQPDSGVCRIIAGVAVVMSSVLIL